MYWSEGSGDNKRSYSSSEDYINEALVLYGKGIKNSTQKNWMSKIAGVSFSCLCFRT